MFGEVVDQTVPHLRLMLVPLVAVPRVVGNGERPGRLEHDRNGGLGDAHDRRRTVTGGLELLIRHTMRNHTALKRNATRLEGVRAAAVVAVDQAHQLGGGVAVVVRRAVGVRGDVPARREDEEVGERRVEVARLGREHAEDGRVDVVDRDGADIDEFRQVVLVRNVVPVPGDDVEGAVVLCALEELAAELVHDLPWLLLDLVLRHGGQEVPRVGEAVGAQGAQLRELELSAPDLEDVPARRTVGEFHAETKATLDDDDLTGLDIQGTELGLNVQSSPLGDDEELAVGVDERFLGHADIRRVDMSSQSLTEGRIARSRHGLEASDELHFPRGGDIKRVPGELGRGDVDARV